MSPRDWRERIRDILQAISEIDVFTHGTDFDDFRADTKTMKAVELNLIVIGEAVAGIPNEIEEKHPQIPWTLMRAMRNRLIHVYFSVDERLLWDTVKNDLPPLVKPLQSLLQ
jgi:uncharacterized protein with HEPN domain